MRGIPIRIHPFFWLVAALIGWMGAQSFAGMLIWMVVIVVSVLVHELGHAITAKLFGLNPQIQLIALGGVTSYEIKDVKFSKQFLITLNGPLFGLLLFGIATGLLYLQLFTHPLIIYTISVFQMINLFWTIVNLIPVLPLDGGQLLRIALEGIFGVRGFKMALFIGMLIALAISMFFLLMGRFLIGAIFFLFAFQSFDAFRKSKHLSKEDRVQDHAQKLQEGEKAYLSGNAAQAEEIFKSVREKTHHGLVYAAATHYLAVIEYEKGQKDEAYELLLSVKEDLAEEALCLLHKLAFEHQNYSLVTELSTQCFQTAPSEDVALTNAKAFALQSQAKPAGGWLQTALKMGKQNLDTILKDGAFEQVKNDPNFLHFFKK